MIKHKKIKSIHFVGVKGVGMTPLAIIAKEAGIKVIGSDITDKFITDEVLRKKDIIPFKGFSENNISNVDLVVTTGAHGGFDNVEVKKAIEKGIKVITQGEALGIFMDGDIFSRKFEGISVAGSHGKTTTTAMLSTIFEKAGMNPSFVIGTSDISSLDAPGHYGKGKYFIAEADEYATEPNYDKTSKFLWQHPKFLIFTNIDFDHPDFFSSIDSVKNAFQKFAKQLSSSGVLIANGDDIEIKKITSTCKSKVILFGQSPTNDFVLKKISISGDQLFFWVDAYGSSLGEFSLQVTGEHNAYNALAAVIGALEAGISIAKIKEGLYSYAGSKRRSEYKGRLESGAYLFDDYAHHPTEIKKTLIGFRQRFPKSKIVCVFQPHTYSRTKYLFDDFISSFNSSDVAIITNIYSSLREKPNSSVSSKLLVEKMNIFNKHALFLPSLNDVVEYINQNSFRDNTVIITMGAGDVYKIHDKLEVENYG